MKKISAIMLAILLLLSLAACSESDASTPEPEKAPTQTQAPAKEPEPAPVPEPEPEPEPEPVEIPDPIVYSGNGDDVLEITPPENHPWVFHIWGNSGESHFAVKGYDNANNYTELFVNTSNSYEGWVLDPTFSTTLLEINCESEWNVEIISVYAMPRLDANEPVSGFGDDVVLLSAPEDFWALQVTGNPSKSHFAVKGYDAQLFSTELFVNTSDAYSGTTLDATQSTALLAVTAESEWTLDILMADELQTYTQGNTITGAGDAVFFVNEPGRAASITGNAIGAHFAVKTYDTNGTDLLVNTTDPYEGKVMLKSDWAIVTVKCEDNWSVVLE